MLQESILQYFRASLSYNLSLRPLFCPFLSGPLRQVLLFLQTGSLANSEDPNEMSVRSVLIPGIMFNPGIMFKIEQATTNRILKLKQIFMAEMHHNLEISACDPLKYKMGNSILILPTCLGKPSE